MRTLNPILTTAFLLHLFAAVHAAPEIILHEGEYYIAALTPDLDGIRVAKFSIPN